MYKEKKQYRLPGFNYASNRAYFITINCANRSHYLGEIYDNSMHLSTMGEMAYMEIEYAMKFKRNVDVKHFVIMPNHIHMIVLFKNDEVSEIPNSAELPLGNGYVRRGRLSPLQKDSLGAFVNSFKGRVTRKCRDEGLMDFGWQSKYHDRIIRDEREYNNIADYINNNVLNWEEDSENV